MITYLQTTLDQINDRHQVTTVPIMAVVKPLIGHDPDVYARVYDVYHNGTQVLWEIQFTREFLRTHSLATIRQTCAHELAHIASKDWHHNQVFRRYCRKFGGCGNCTRYIREGGATTEESGERR